MNVDPSSLIPKLPNPRDLQPFPTQQAVLYSGHQDKVTSLTVDPSGQWLATGSEDKTVRFWELMTGRCMKVCSSLLYCFFINFYCQPKSVLCCQCDELCGWISLIC